MRVRKLGHSCLLVEEGSTRLLVDPGSFSAGFEALTGLTAVLITHQHADHLDLGRLPGLLAANPDTAVVADRDGADVLADRQIAAQAVRAGDSLDLGGVTVTVHGSQHALIHPEIPRITNVGYLIAGRLFHPGDAFTVPDVPVEVLALPAAAPWLRVGDAVDYLRTIGPRLAVPIHEQVSAHPELYYRTIERLAPDDTTFRIIDDGVPLEL